MKERLIEYWKNMEVVKDSRIINAFKDIPREEFMLDEYRDKAYYDSAFPIIKGQTISQPTTIMIMTQALEPKKNDKVLEIGSGSGYQAALLSKLCKKIVSIERIHEVAEYAKHNLNRLNIKNVEIIETDGSLGYEKEAPYDKMIVTAASPKIPEIIVNQLKENGVIVIPVGASYSCEIIKAKKIKGKLKKESLGNFSFVPLIGKEGYKL
jgi:protein-L-isoaspartate(D-aspartate) O-methyltransferase